MNSIIFQSQSTFVKGQSLADGAVVVNEMVDMVSKLK